MLTLSQAVEKIATETEKAQMAPTEYSRTIVRQAVERRAIQTLASISVRGEYIYITTVKHSEMLAKMNFRKTDRNEYRGHVTDSEKMLRIIKSLDSQIADLLCTDQAFVEYIQSH